MKVIKELRLPVAQCLPRVEPRISRVFVPPAKDNKYTRPAQVGRRLDVKG